MLQNNEQPLRITKYFLTIGQFGLLLACDAHKAWSLPVTRLCSLYDGDEVFGGSNAQFGLTSTVNEHSRLYSGKKY